MDYKLVDKEAFKVVGKSKKITTKDRENMQLVEKFWGETMQDGSYEKICAMASKAGVFGICMDFEQSYETFTYMIAVEDIDNKTDEFEVAEIPAATWAVFESVGPMPSAIQKVWERIYSEWFPSTGYEHAMAPELEVYPVGNIYADDYRCEVWIPIKK